MQVGKVLVAAGEQAAERREGKIAGLRDRSRSRFLKGVQNRRPENARDKIVSAGERLRGIEIDRLEPREMIGLGGARSVRRREFCAALHTKGRRDDDEILLRAVSVEADREPRFPLRVGEAPESPRSMPFSASRAASSGRRFKRSSTLLGAGAEPAMSPTK